MNTYGIAIIDDGMDIELYRSLTCGTIIHYVEVHDNKISYYDHSNRKNYGHGTICASLLTEFLEMNKATENVDIVFISICELPNNLNLRNLLIGIQRCIQNDIDMILMSLGVTNSVYSRCFYPILDIATNKKITVIAASSNDDIITYPACFSKVIGVRKDCHCSKTNQIEVVENPIDGIEIIGTFNKSLTLKKIERKFNTIFHYRTVGLFRLLEQPYVLY